MSFCTVAAGSTLVVPLLPVQSCSKCVCLSIHAMLEQSPQHSHDPILLPGNSVKPIPSCHTAFRMDGAGSSARSFCRMSVWVARFGAPALPDLPQLSCRRPSQQVKRVGTCTPSNKMGLLFCSAWYRSMHQSALPRNISSCSLLHSCNRKSSHRLHIARRGTEPKWTRQRFVQRCAAAGNISSCSLLHSCNRKSSHRLHIARRGTEPKWTRQRFVQRCAAAPPHSSEHAAHAREVEHVDVQARAFRHHFAMLLPSKAVVKSLKA